ncbi:MAG: deoxyguanosinetriphosphate triphosphohydrolase family protein [Solirubrobacteraceae bacterium]|jgi:dGTPase
MSTSWWDERRYLEPAPGTPGGQRSRTRTHGERDRDRVLYCSAFQRLAGITQVAPAGAGQAVHSRLTHSLKVAQVAHRLAQRIVDHDPDLSVELDPDSVEAAALAHDLGHPPFGHIAEEELKQFAIDSGCDGFEGNAQSFRLVTRLSQRWPSSDGEDFGLNLTRRTLDGLLKYPWPRNRDDPHKSAKWGAYDADGEAFKWVRKRRRKDQRSLAAEVMDWADDVTYAVHDMEDFFRAGLVPLDRLCTSVDERDRFRESFRDEKGGQNKRLAKHDLAVLDDTAEHLFDLIGVTEPYTGDRTQRQVLRERTSLLIRDYMHAFDVQRGKAKIDPASGAEVAVLKELMWFYVIDRQELATVQAGQRQIISGLAKRFCEAAIEQSFELFPPLERTALREASTDAAMARVVVDYVARLTEARALELHRRFAGVAPPLLTAAAH